MSRDDRRVPDGDTIYEFGSATKVLTGILLADAVVQGRAKLDQPAGDLLPAGVKMPAKGDHAITLQDLSTHVSGLPRIPDNMKFSDPHDPYADYREQDLYAFLNKHELAGPRGKKRVLQSGCRAAWSPVVAAGEIDLRGFGAQSDRRAAQDVQHENHLRQKIAITVRARAHW